MADDQQTADAGAALPAVPTLPEDILESVREAVARGASPETALADLREAVRDAILEAGASSASADAAAGVFVDTFQGELFQGGQTVAEAGAYAQQAMARAIETYDPSTADPSPADALLSAIASGEGLESAVAGVVAEMGQAGAQIDPETLEAIYLDALQDALAAGADPAAAMAEATGAAAEGARSLAEAEVPVENPILNALSGGQGVDAALNQAAQASGGDTDAFIEGLESSLAEGADAQQAMREAQQAAADTAAAKADAEVPLSAGDQLAAALAAGEDVSAKIEQAGGGEAFASALEESLAGGAGGGDALQAAGEAEARQAELQSEQAVPLSAADQLAASLATGKDVDEALGEAGGDGAFAAALEESLASGGTPDSALASGQQAADAAASVQADQSVPVSAADQLAASLASGENVDQALQEVGGGEAFAEELAANLADGAAPDQSVAQAQSAQNAASETEAAQEVPADPALEALAQGGDAAQGADVANAVAEATGETGGSQAAGTESDPAQTQPQQTAETAPEQAAEQTQPQQTAETAPEPAAEQTQPQQTAETAPGTAPETAPETAPGTTTDPQAAETQTQASETEQTAEGDGEARETSEEEGQPETQTADSVEAVAEGAGDGDAATGDAEGAADAGVTQTIQTAGTGDGSDDGEVDADALADAAALDDIATAAGGDNGGSGGSGVTFDSARNASNIGGSGSPLGSGDSGGFQSTVTVGGSSGAGGGGGGRTRRDDDGGRDVLTGGAGDDDPIIVNSAPVASADSATTTENATIRISVLVNDSDPDGDALTLVSASGPLGKGTVGVSGSSITFDPGADFNHLDVDDTEVVSLSYTIRDSAGNTANGSVSLTVTATNDAPVIEVVGTDPTGGVTEATDNATAGSPALTTSGTIAFTDLDAHGTHTVDAVAAGRAQGTLAVSIATPAAGATGEVAWTYTAPEAAFDYLAAGASVIEEFSVTITDDQGASVQQTVQVTVTGTNDSPQVAGPVDGGVLSEDAPVLTVDLLTGASDVDSRDMGVANVAVLAAGGRPLHYAVDLDTGMLSFDPGQFEDLAAGEALAVSVSYDVVDGAGASVAQTASVTIAGSNDGPEAIVAPGPYAGAEEAAIAVDGVSVVDVDFGDTLTVTLTAGDGGTVTAGANGGGATIAQAGTGQMTISGSAPDVNMALETLGYTGAENFAGESSISVRVSDGTAVTTESVSVTVTPVNDAPTLSVPESGPGAVAALDAAKGAYIDVPDAALNNQVAGTIETWVYFENTTTGAIFTKQHNFVDSYAILFVQGGQLSYKSDNASGTLVGDTAIEQNTWHHVAVSFDADGARMYLDGVEIAAMASTVPNQFKIADDTSIGAGEGGAAIGAWLAHGGGQYLNGAISEFRIWDIGRTEAEIQAGMNAKMTGTEPGLRALYTFSDSFAHNESVADATGSYDAISNFATSDSAGISGLEDSEIPITGITVGDVDGDVLTVTVEAPDGSTLALTPGAGAADVDAAGTAQAVIRGTAADVNAALETLTFKPPHNFNGTAQLSVSVNDGTTVENATLDVTVRSVPDPIVAPEQTARTVLMEDFEGSTSGWSDGRTLTTDDLTTTLGRFGDGPVEPESTQKTFFIDGQATQAQIHFTLHVLDSWDNETFIASINGTEVASNAFKYGEDQSKPGFMLTSGLYRSDVAATGDWTDQVYAVEINLDADQLSDLSEIDGEGNRQLTLEFTSTLDQQAADESWAIDNLTLLAGTPTESFAAGSEMLMADLLAGFTGGEAPLSVSNVRVSASDGRVVEIDGDVEASGVLSADMGQFADLMGRDRNLLLKVDYDVSDGVTTQAASAVYEVRGVSEGPNTAPILSASASALTLDGTSSHVVIQDDPALDVTDTFTIEMWVKADGAGTLVSKDGSGGHDTTGAYNLELTDSGGGLFGLTYETNNRENSLSVADVVTAGEWHHVAVSFDHGAVSLYVDGTEVGSRADTPAPYVLNTDLLIGRRGYENDERYFKGQIDDVRLWDTARHETEIQTYMNQQLMGMEAGLAGNWTFDEADGVTVVDRSANGNDGTIQGTEARENLVHISIQNNETYKGLLLGQDGDQDQLFYSLQSGPAHGTVELDGNSFVYNHNDGGGNDSFTVAISDGTDTVTEQIDITVG